MAIDTLISVLGLVNLIALMAVVIIGLPHGAFDGVVSIYLGYSSRSHFSFSFVGVYIGLSGLVVYLWLIFPVASLITFLAFSIIHFGLGDARAASGWFRWIQALAHGSMVVAGISQSHRPEVGKIFYYLSDGMAEPIWYFIDIVSVIAVVAIIIYGWKAVWEYRWRMGFLEMIILLILFSQVPPLVGFAFYFCCIHSTRHLLKIWKSIKTIMLRRMAYVQTGGLTVISWFAGGFAFWFCSSEFTLESSILRVIFIGLAALTVPHMLLIDFVFRRHSVHSY
jgi:Brp/Blh family beta-carotene 15,15'-monooxygenase